MTTTNEIQIRPTGDLLPDMEQMRTFVAVLHKSEVFPHIKNEAQMFTIIEFGRILGMYPIPALQTISFVKGKLCIESKVLLAQFYAKGGKVTITKKDKTGAEAKFKVEDRIHTDSFTIEDAKALGFTTKDNWKMYPEEMCWWRLVAKAIRVIDPGVMLGVLTKEEVEDFKESEPRGKTPDPPPQDITPRAKRVAAKAPEPIKKEAPAKKADPKAEPEPEPETEGTNNAISDVAIEDMSEEMLNSLAKAGSRPARDELLRREGVIDVEGEVVDEDDFSEGDDSFDAEQFDTPGREPGDDEDEDEGDDSATRTEKLIQAEIMRVATNLHKALSDCGLESGAEKANFMTWLVEYQETRGKKWVGVNEEDKSVHFSLGELEDMRGLLYQLPKAVKKFRELANGEAK